MRNLRLGAVVCLFATFICAAAASTQAADAPAVSSGGTPVFLSGLVTLTDGVTPLAKAVVRAVPTNKGVTHRLWIGQTDATGTFILFSPLESDTYTIEVSEGGNSVPLQQITVEANTGPIGIRLQMPSGSLSGFALNIGQPAGRVMLLIKEQTSGHLSVKLVDANGNWSFAHLLPGKYDVTADTVDAKPPLSAKQSGVIVGSDAVSLTLALEARPAVAARIPAAPNPPAPLHPVQP